MLNKNEALLLGYLRWNARKPLAQISKETAIPMSTLFDSLRKLELKAVDKYVSLLNFARLGYHIKVGFIISSGQKRQLLEFLESSMNVNTMQQITNGADFYIECLFKDMAEMEDFRSSLGGFDIKMMREMHLIDEMKKEMFAP